MSSVACSGHGEKQMIDAGLAWSEHAWPQDRQAARNSCITVVNLTKGAGDVLRQSKE